MGPSIGELNKSLFWSSDYFLIPCSPDSYCTTTMKTMERTLPLWAEQQARLAEVTKDMTMPVNPEPPKFLGILMGLFQTTGKDKNPIKDSQYWMDVIKATVKSELAPVLMKVGMFHPNAPDDFTLAEIPHFLSLMPIAQRAFAPVFDIPDQSFTTENEDGDMLLMPKSEIARHQERAQYFFQKYDALASVLVNIFNVEDTQDSENLPPINGKFFNYFNSLNRESGELQLTD